MHLNISYQSIFLRFLKFGFLAWGGPVAQIGMLKHELVEKEKWVSPERFNKALAVYQILPGPEATELCCYFGMVAKGRLGAILAGLGFVLPGFTLMLLLSWLYVEKSLQSSFLAAAFVAMQPAVTALIIRAVYRIGSHAVANLFLLFISMLSLIASLFGVPFWIPLIYGGIAYVSYKAGKYPILALSTLAYILLVILSLRGVATDSFTFSSSARIGAAVSLSDLFFAGLRAGLLTFGGAYTVIPYLQKDAVTTGAWMTNSQFMDGLALSGILPAPLIIFSTFVGYVGAGLMGAFAMTFAIFLPAFCFTLLGHDIIEKVTERRRIHHFLEGVTSAVVGLIAATSITIFFETVKDLYSLIVFIAAFLSTCFFKAQLSVLFIVLGAGCIGLFLF